MMVSRNSGYLGLPGEVTLGHNADHSKLVKFPTSEDSRYLAVASYIQKAIDRINGVDGEYEIHSSSLPTGKL